MNLAAAVLVAALSARAESAEQLLAEAERLASIRVRRADQAETFYRRAIEAARRAGNRRIELEAWSGLAAALLNLHRQEEVLAISERIMELARAENDDQAVVKAMRHQAMVLFERADFDKAWTIYAEMLRFGEERRIPAARVRALNNMAVVSRNIGNLPQAIHYSRRALREMDAQLPGVITKDLEFAIPYNLGRAMIDGGDFAGGFVYLRRALDVAERDSHRAGIWHVLFDTASWYEAQGDYAKAQHYYERAYQQSLLIESLDPRATSLRGMGTLALRRGDVATAANYLAEAIAAFERAGYRNELSMSYLAATRAAALQGRRDEARRLLTEAESLARSHKQSAVVGLALLERSRQMLPDDGVAAERAAVDALALIEENGLRTLVPSALVVLAEIAISNGDLPRAVVWLQRSVSAIERVRSTVPSHDLRIAFNDAMHITRERLIEVYLAQYLHQPSRESAERLFQTIDGIRGQTLLESRRRTKSTPALEQARSRIASLQARLTLPNISDDQRNQMLRELSDAEREAALAEGKSATPGEAQRSFAEMARQLRPDEAFLSFTQTSTEHLALVVHAGRLEVIKLRPERLADRIEFFAAALAGGDADAALASGTAISSLLFAPVLPRIPAAVRRLVISAAGETAAIPFSALPHPHTRRPVAESYAIGFSPSLEFLAMERRSAKIEPTAPLLAFASPNVALQASLNRDVLARPLLEAEREVREISSLVAGEDDVVVGSDVTEAELKRRDLGRYGVVHLATHAILDPVIPERSAILLQRGNATEDGWLQAREIREQAIRGVVVLSGCETATGRTSAAQGVHSLASAFSEAGAPATVASLWKVDDREARVFMQAFYRRLTAGDDVAEALRRAQVETAGDQPYATARLWAAWVVSGDPRTVTPLRRSLLRQPLWWAAVVVTVVIMGLVAISVRRPRVGRSTGDGPRSALSSRGGDAPGVG